MFDEFGWNWEYEPNIDFPKLDCGAWIPDFKLTPRPDYRQDIGKPILVEVKPADSIDELIYVDGVTRAYNNAVAAGYDLLIVGPKPLKNNELILRLGVYATNTPDHKDIGITETDVFDALFVWMPSITSTARRMDADIIVPIYGIKLHEPRLSGRCLAEYLELNEPAFGPFEDIWATAKNATQWKSPRGTLR